MDTLKQMNNLKDAGFNNQQAESIVENWSSIMDENFATKEDLKDLEHRMDKGFKEVDHKLEKMELSMTVKFGFMILGMIGILRWLQIINL